ncbi:MAG: flagellar hook-length control protein FliK, partial [Planctomycetota bacterium]
RLTGAGANQTDGAGQTPRVDASRFVGRVGKAIQAAQQRGGEVKLRLSPPELGALQIKLLMGEGTLTATLEAETSAARNLLLENLPALRERLAEQDIRIEKFDVDVRDERRQGGGDQADQRRPGGGRPDGGRSGDQRSGERTAGSNQREAKAAQQPPAGTPHASGAQGPASEAINLVA